MKSQSIMVVAGEASGDLHAAPIIAELRRRRPELKFMGAGGELMKAEDVELFAEVKDLAVMGFSGIPKILPRLARLKKTILEHVEQERIPLVILTDYPGFNLNLARSLKKIPHPPKILYYIAPQLWAWREGRVRRIRENVDKLAVVFEFEVEFFRKHGVESVFVGHPLLDELSGSTPLAKDESSPLLALLPGSRESVAARHLFPMIEAAAILKSKVNGLRVAIARASGIKDWSGWKKARQAGIEIMDDSRELLRRATLAAVCSGTATLEAALMGVPQIVVYKTSFLNYHIARSLVRIPNVSLVNVTAGRKVVTELIQSEFTGENLAAKLLDLQTDKEVRRSILKGYEEVKRSLGDRGAALRVADLAESML